MLPPGGVERYPSPSRAFSHLVLGTSRFLLGIAQAEDPDRKFKLRFGWMPCPA